jgi:pimeloyl-CoA synthetase
MPLNDHIDVDDRTDEERARDEARVEDVIARTHTFLPIGVSEQARRNLARTLARHKNALEECERGHIEKAKSLLREDGCFTGAFVLDMCTI